MTTNFYPIATSIIVISISSVFYSCATADSNEQAKDVIDEWCECMQKHRTLKSDAHRICTEKYQEDLTQVMLLRSQEVMNDTSLTATQHNPNDSSNVHLLKRHRFEAMGKFLREMSKKCLDDL